MQLFVLVLMLMAMGKNANIKEIQPILESLGGEEATDAFKQAEEFNSVISAVQSLATLAKSSPAGNPSEVNFNSSVRSGGGKGRADGEYSQAPLAPISRIADESITRCLAQYIALGE